MLNLIKRVEIEYLIVSVAFVLTALSIYCIVGSILIIRSDSEMAVKTESQICNTCVSIVTKTKPQKKTNKEQKPIPCVRCIEA